MTIRFRSASSAIVAGVAWSCLAIGAQAQPDQVPPAVPRPSSAAEETPDTPPTQPPPDTEDQSPAEPAEPPPDPAAAPPADITVAKATLNALPERIDKAKALVEGLNGRVAELQGRNTITPEQATQYMDVLTAQRKTLKASLQTVQSLRTRSAAPAEQQGELAQDVDHLEQQVGAVESTLEALAEQLIGLGKEKGWSLVETLLDARCATAICFANGEDQYWLGIEPLIELPVGISSAIGNTSLADYINNHELRVDLAAGIRVWLFDDVISISVYLSKALIDSKVRAVGSDFVYPGSAVRRAFPGFAIGLLFDSIWVGFDRNELRNGDSDNAMSFNSDFPPNSVVSSAWTITVALLPVTAFRTAIGTAKKASEAD